MSRSATIAAAYLMQKNKQDCETTIALIKQSRPRVNPNSAFRAQLKHWHQTEFGLHTDTSRNVLSPV